ncbi:MAG: diaminopimelate decarboxylase [bacterium]
MNDTTFHYRDREDDGASLYCEDLELSKIASEHGTPVYVYSKSQLAENYQSIASAISSSGKNNWVSYAIKANSNPTLLKILAELGAGASVVSGGELVAALRAGFSPNRISFDGPGKTDEEIILALKSDIFAIDIESIQELSVVNQLAESLGVIARICIRVNPHVDAKTHPYISTGLSHNKFGISLDDAFLAYRMASKMSNVQILGLHSHIGSQITELGPYREAAESLVEFVNALRLDEGINMSHINIGGGQGVGYHNVISHSPIPQSETDIAIPSFQEFAAAILPILYRTGCSVNIEPGRAIVANTCALLTKVLYTKSNGDKNFIIVDAGMNDLIRPSLYQAYHQIVPLKPQKNESIVSADIVGPICETGDFLAQSRRINAVERGEYLAVMCAGAYGFVLSSNYNLRTRGAEILVDGSSFTVIRERQKIEDIIY